MDYEYGVAAHDDRITQHDVSMDAGCFGQSYMGQNIFDLSHHNKWILLDGMQPESLSTGSGQVFDVKATHSLPYPYLPEDIIQVL